MMNYRLEHARLDLAAAQMHLDYLVGICERSQALAAKSNISQDTAEMDADAVRQQEYVVKHRELDVLELQEKP